MPTCWQIDEKLTALLKTILALVLENVKGCLFLSAESRVNRVLLVLLHYIGPSWPDVGMGSLGHFVPR
jgi:hypothetical protein